MRKIYLRIKKELIIPLFLVIVGAFSFGNAMAQGDSLRVHWDFEGDYTNQTGDVIDVSGNGNNLADRRSGKFTIDGKVNSGYYFDPLTSWKASRGTNKTLGITNEISFMAWIYQTGGIDISAREGGISKTNSFELRVVQVDNPATQVKYYIAARDNSERRTGLTSTTSYTVNSWHHVAATFDGVTLKLYVDGILDSSIPALSGTELPLADIATAYLRCGTSAEKGGEILDGKLDEFKLFNKVITATQINNEYRAASIDNTPPTVTSSTPADGATNVALNEDVIITFNEEMNDVSVVITGDLTSVVKAWNTGKTELTLSHDAFGYSTSYDVIINGEDVAGNAMTETTISFTTASDINDNLLLYWDFEDQAQGKIVDVTGNGHEPNEWKTNATFSTDNPKKGTGTISFDGGNWHGVRLASSTLSTPTEITVMAWFYQNGAVDSKNGGVCKEFTWDIFVDDWNRPSGKFGYGFIMKNSDGDQEQLATTTTVDVGSGWHHVAVTYDKSTLTIYIDGVAAGTEDIVNFNIRDDAQRILCGTAASKNNTLNGNLDDVKVYSIALTANEIANEYFGEAISKTWTGATNSDWSTPTNWNPLIAPTPTDVVLIPSAVASDNWPTISSTVTIESLILNSTSKQATGSLIISSGALVTTNEAVIKRFIDKENWHIVSSPVIGQDQKSFGAENGLSIYSAQNEYDLATYDEANGNWAGWIKTDGSNSSAFLPGKGYLTRLSQGELGRAVSFAGSSVSSGTIPVAITRSANGWNSIGNPYSSSIKANSATNSFLSANIGQLDATYSGLYFWDQVAGDYEIVSLADAETTIALGQGFVVKAKSGGGAVNFVNAMQVHNSTDYLKSGETTNPEIELSVLAGKNQNSTKIILLNGATEDLDPGYDVGKFKGNKNIALFSKLVSNTSSVDFGLQCLPLDNSCRIPIGLELTEGGEVTFTANANNLKENMQVILEDVSDNSFTNLTAEDAKYTTTVSSSNLKSGRFFLHTSNSTTSADRISDLQEYKVYTRDKLIFVEGEMNNNSKIALYGVDGKLFYQNQDVNSNIVKIDASNFPAGVYLVVVKSTSNTKTQKVVLSN